MSVPNAPQPDSTHAQPTLPYPTSSYPTAPYPSLSEPASAPAQQDPYRAAPQYAPQASTATTMGDTNTYAVLAIIFAFVAPIAGIIFGHLGFSQIKRNGDAGRGLALTGLIISYAYFAFLLIFIVAYIGLIAVMIGTLGTAFSSTSSMY